MTDFCKQLEAHYVQIWGGKHKIQQWDKGPTMELPEGFRILQFEPTKQRNAWTYASCCMSQANDKVQLELHLLSPISSDLHVELLTAIAHYHRTGSPLNLGHTVNFGRPWLPGSTCNFGLISLPYLDGPKLETLSLADGKVIKCYWLVPITEKELAYKKANGIEALEQMFERKNFNCLDQFRSDIV